MIKEAAAQYRVSRAKLHRLIQAGRLRATTDPRDERVTLLRTDELERLFSLPLEEEEPEMGYQTDAEDYRAGNLTAELCAQMDTLRARVFEGQKLKGDSTEIIREERQRRARQLLGAAGDADEESPRRA